MEQISTCLHTDHPCDWPKLKSLDLKRSDTTCRVSVAPTHRILVRYLHSKAINEYSLTLVVTQQQVRAYDDHGPVASHHRHMI